MTGMLAELTAEVWAASGTIMMKLQLNGKTKIMEHMMTLPIPHWTKHICDPNNFIASKHIMTIVCDP
jgi:hypothetical protein